MKSFIIRTTSHNAAITSGTAEIIMDKWDELMQNYDARAFKIFDREGNLVSIKDVEASLTEEEVEEVKPIIRNNDDKLWPWEEVGEPKPDEESDSED